MARNAWTGWQGPPVRRQFVCSLENAAWGEGWRGAQILRIKLVLATRTTAPRREAQGASENVVLRAEAPGFVVTVEHPRKRGDPQSLVRQRCDDAGAIFDALLAVFKKPGYVSAWDDVREEVLKVTI